MVHLIDKDALVAEIKRRMDENSGKQTLPQYFGMIEEDLNILSFIDTLEVKEGGVWKTIDNINLPQADKNKIYCVFTNDRYILATVINHPKDEDLLQWKCTEFPFHRYDMCEGDKYMQIV